MTKIGVFTRAATVLLSCSTLLFDGWTPMAAAQDPASPAKKSASWRDAVIVLADKQIDSEKTAAMELAHYLRQVTAGEFPVVAETEASRRKGPKIFVGPTRFAANKGLPVPATLGSEEWIVRATGPEHLVIIGGRPRGTLYAAYHFLEDVVGVHWWNPWEESVPSKAALDIADVDLRGKPAFSSFRDDSYPYGQDDGRFAARSRLNSRTHGKPVSLAYGGSVVWGPPSFVHTFHKYFDQTASMGNQTPPGLVKLFESHPEYFSLINGTREIKKSQLCLTNRELRKLFAGKLQAFVQQGIEDARKNNTSPPLRYNISPMDWRGACECDRCQGIAKAEDSEAGPLLDFVNEMADTVRDAHPDVFIETLAYLHTQKPPKNIKARENVSVMLCNTDVNTLQDILSEDNAGFRSLVQDWAAIAKHLAVWEYVVTFKSPAIELPRPTLKTYPTTFRFYRENGVTGLFLEDDWPILRDMQDLKLWMSLKLMEDPEADYGRLLTTFTDGFYGPAGKTIRDYLDALEQAAARTPTRIGLQPGAFQYRYLDLDFTLAAHKLFDQAEEAVKADPPLLRRVRYARMSLDRATGLRYSRLSREWSIRGNDPGDFPLRRQDILDRYRLTFNEQVDLRKPSFIRRKADDEIKTMLSLPEHVDPPTRFKDYDSWRVFDYPAALSVGFRRLSPVVADEEAESGQAVRAEWPLPEGNQYSGIFRDKNKLPMEWGIYRRGAYVARAQITAADVPGPGYHWYKVGTLALDADDTVNFCGGLLNAFSVGDAPTAEHTKQQFEVWARIKFEGPAFPHGKAEAKNAICVERVVALDVTGL